MHQLYLESHESLISWRLHYIAGGEVGAEAPASTHSAEDRYVPRGVRPGRPVLAQPAETSQDSSKAPIQDSNFSPDAAGKPIDSTAVPEPIMKPPAEKLVPKEASGAKQPKSVSSEDSEKEAKRLLDEEEERRKQRRRKKGRIRELEEIRAELAEKELVLLSKEQELLERDQTVNVLREEVGCSHPLLYHFIMELPKDFFSLIILSFVCSWNWRRSFARC